MKSRNREMFKVGPIGSKQYYDKSWEEKGRNMISSIYVAFNKDSIKCIQFSYFHNGVHVVSEKHGSSKGQSYEIVRLNADEYVTGLSGIFWERKVTSLTFHTNQGKHGPFCNGTGYSSSYMADYKKEIDVKIRDRREFGGFFGSFDDEFDGLTSIGIYVYPTYDNKPTLNQAWDPLYAFAHNQIPTIADGIPVMHIRYKPKLKDRIFSKLDFKRAMLCLIKVFLD
ncbi:unnamed protein product [Arabidopsis thaliana]|uniref:Jacalin-type lectin domain-containing protein n=1 Tax=Arabidopsis thaliana TaxID=3702 RepID=A0A5S9X6Z8_ARATH|nr:unnamed protein product [Arabidopsis thaliana]